MNDCESLGWNEQAVAPEDRVVLKEFFGACRELGFRPLIGHPGHLLGHAALIMTNVLPRLLVKGIGTQQLRDTLALAIPDEGNYGQVRARFLAALDTLLAAQA